MKLTRTYKLSVLLALVLCLSLAMSACGGGNAPATEPDVPDESAGNEEQNAGADDHSDWIDIEYTYATYLPDANPMARFSIGAINEELEKVMPGVTITIYPSGTLLGQNDIYDGILTGTCDIGLIDYGTVMRRFPVSQLWFLPGAIDNARAITVLEAFTEWGQTTSAAEYNDTVLIWGTGNGPMCLYTRSKIASIDDLKGKQIRASAIYGSTIAAYGAVQVTMDTSEVYEAMRNGMLEGTYNVLPAAANSNLDEVGHYALINPGQTTLSGTLMSKKSLEKMPPSQQEAFLACVETAFTRMTTAMEENEKGGRIAECVQNSEVEFMDGAVLEEFTKAGESLLNEYVKELDDQGLDGTGELAKIRELVKKYSDPYSWEDYKGNFFEDEFLFH